jgi:hypothetical protein
MGLQWNWENPKPKHRNSEMNTETTKDICMGYNLQRGNSELCALI